MIISQREVGEKIVILNKNGKTEVVDKGKITLLQNKSSNHFKYINSEVSRFYPEGFFLFSPTVAFIENFSILDAINGNNNVIKSFSKEEIIEKLDFLYHMRIQHLIFSSADHLTHPNIAEILYYADQKKLTINIITDLLNLQEDSLLQVPGNTFFLFTLDLVSQQLNNQMAIPFQKIYELIKTLEDKNSFVQPLISVHLANPKNIDNIITWCLQHQLPRPQWLETQHIGKAIDTSNLVLQTEYIKLFAMIFHQKNSELHQKCNNDYIY